MLRSQQEICATSCTNANVNPIKGDCWEISLVFQLFVLSRWSSGLLKYIYGSFKSPLSVNSWFLQDKDSCQLCLHTWPQHKVDLHPLQRSPSQMSCQDIPSRFLVAAWIYCFHGNVDPFEMLLVALWRFNLFKRECLWCNEVLWTTASL